MGLQNRSNVDEAIWTAAGKKDPIEMILFSLIGSNDGETIGAGMLHWFAAVHSFVQDEKGEEASLLIGAVSGDFLHIESFLEVSPIFPLTPPPQFF